jgi:hypothetical protein
MLLSPNVLSASPFQHSIQPSFHFSDPLLRCEAEILNEDMKINSCSPGDFQFAAARRVFNDLQKHVTLFRCDDIVHVGILSHG